MVRPQIPELIVIGAPRSGSTSLHFYLDLHPEICMSLPKELNFYLEENWLSKDLDWYRSHFSGENIKVLGDSSPAYTLFPIHKGIPERIFQTVPMAKFIYLVRDPIERTLSHYIYSVTHMAESKPLEDALQQVGNRYLVASSYFLQISQYLKYFSKNQILIVLFENLILKKRETMKRIFEFIKVQPDFWHADFDLKHNSEATLKAQLVDQYTFSNSAGMSHKIVQEYTSFQKPTLSKELENFIRESLWPDIKQFQEYSELDLAVWKKFFQKD